MTPERSEIVYDLVFTGKRKSQHNIGSVSSHTFCWVGLGPKIYHLLRFSASDLFKRVDKVML